METILENFHFIRPWALLLLPLCFLAFWVLMHFEKRSSEWRSLIDKSLLPYLLEGKISQTKKMPYYGLLSLLIVLCLALAGPTWEKKPQPVQRDTSSLVILWDLSPSMYSQDIKPSRVVRARLKLSDLLDERKDGLTALIAYSGDAHVVTPLTDDTKTIKNLLTGLSPAIMPSKGSNPEHALETAIELLKDTNIQKGDIVFITDDIPYSAFTELRSISAQAQHRITVWGIGTSEGAPIPLPQGGFAKNTRGEIVVARVDHQGLSEAAVNMGGAYIPFSDDSSDIESIMHFGFKLGNTNTAESENERLMDQWKEVGHWLVLACLPFAALAFRRGWLMIFLCGVLVLPEKSYAFQWQDLWLNKNQQAQRLLDAEQPDAAAQTFKNKDWKAIANYKSGDFESAQKHFEQLDGSDNLYNLGNSLTHQGQYDAAITAFEKAINQKESFPEAEKNLAIAKKLKELEEQQQNQDSQDGQQGENSDQQQDNQAQGNQNQEQHSQDQRDQNDQQQNSQQQESQENNDSQQGGSQENNQEQSSDNAQNQQGDQAADEQEKDQQALEDHYQQNEENPDSSEQKQQQAQLLEQSESESDPNKQQGQALVQTKMSQEEMEQQQALEQWLRRVPDDPSGLLREKFKHEYNKRRRENFEQRLRSPNDMGVEERW